MSAHRAQRPPPLQRGSILCGWGVAALPPRGGWRPSVSGEWASRCWFIILWWYFHHPGLEFEQWVLWVCISVNCIIVAVFNHNMVRHFLILPDDETETAWWIYCVMKTASLDQFIHLPLTWPESLQGFLQGIMSYINYQHMKESVERLCIHQVYSGWLMVTRSGDFLIIAFRQYSFADIT